ncbi:PaaX family transcriptional regulator C-terminal domain-containing protein [Streptomyces oceani]|uniref:PaaX family transcriptional regulator n=1 Tax=Streptomyces oceani TaxID=1075402 RepID=A0A1E7KKV1_9ACTN|nr:PaaX family transcriptional regulator C-terminal domain-containing protein [Streptomyces oceani]OEV04514.1 PaaX family transcriptional regulator [Streptomyces oceani]
MPESEPHIPSPRSLIITFYGAYGREFGEDGTVPIAVLIRLLGAVGVDAPSVRSAVSRLKRRGLLVPRPATRTGARSAAYAPSEAAWQLLRDGDRRIYDRPSPDGDWLLAVFSVPESERRQRHVLRSRLSRLGFGNAAPGVWIAPAQLEKETRHTLSRLELTGYVDLFRGAHAGFEPTASGVARWWDLPAIAALHREFLAAQEPVLRSWAHRREVPAREACRDYLLALDAWRRLPYADPGLPARLLPADWPGERAAEVFAQLHRRLRDAGAGYPAKLWEEA